MGRSRPSEAYTASMLSVIYRDTDNPDKTENAGFPVQACFGSIHKKGCRLDPNATFSTIVAPSEGLNLFQGDVIEIDLSTYRQDIPNQQFGMVISHSCEIERSCGVLVAPIFRESELTKNTIEYLKSSPARSPDAVRSNWLNNESQKYIAFPPHDLIDGKPDDDEPFLISLALITTVPLTKFPPAPVARIKYRALAFLQWRLGIYFGRDVQNSDETREF